MNTKKWYASKTLWVAILTGIIGVLVALETQYPAVGWIITGKAVIDFLLRMVTTSSLE